MSKPILMPQVGQDLEEGKLIEWRVKVGDTIAKGDIVAVVESEKASFEVEAFETGTVLDLLYQEGDITKVLAPIMYVGGLDERSGNASKPAPAPVPPSAASQPTPETAGAAVDEAAVVESVAAPALGQVAGGSQPAAKPGRSSPLARRLAGANGIDVASLSGTGPRGAVLKRDIESALHSRAPSAPAVRTPQSTPAASPSVSKAGGQAASLHRVWIRKGQGDPVVMIHGFGADHNAWRILAAAASLSRPILGIDLPGHGKSAGGAASLDEMASAVAATLAEEGITSADLVAHSLGGAVAVAVAEAARFTVRSLFLLAPAGLGPDINSEFLSGFGRARSEATLAPWMALLVADPASMGPVFIRVTAETRAQDGVAEAQAQVAQDFFPDGTQVFSIRQALTALGMPVRIVFGAADRIIPVRHMAGLPGTIAQHIFPNVGHMPQIEAKEAVARLLAEHLRAAG